MFLVALAVGVALVAAAVVLVAVTSSRRGRLRPGGAPAGIDVPTLSPAEAWRAAGPLLEALGLRKLDAECYRRELAGLRETLFVNVSIANASLRGWLERPCPGGALEQYFGADVELGPGDRGRSELGHFVAAAVGELFATLPRQARLKVAAPEIPGDAAKMSLSTPFTAPEHAALVTRVLLALDEAARRPAPEGARAHLPPVAMAWQAASPLLEALGLSRLDAECYRRELDGLRATLFVNVDIRNASLRGWFERPCPGGALEQYLGAEVELSPGGGGRSDLAHFVAGAVGELLAALPRQARLKVEAPEIPGDSYKTSLSTPFTVPEEVAGVVRVLLALDEAARRPSAGAAHARLPPVVVCWQAAAPLLEALGLTRLDAECYRRELAGLRETLFVGVDVKNASVAGWLDRPGPGGVLERFLGAEITLKPGERGRSELEHFVAGAIGEVMGALPRSARLSVNAPELAGDSYKMRLTTPFTAPDQAALVARVLLTLDEALRR